MKSNSRSSAKKGFTQELANQIKKARQSRGISQEKLAHDAGLYRTYIGHIETGTYSPSVYTVWRIAKALNMKLSELFKNL